MPPSSDSAVRTSFSQISKLSGSSSCSTCQQSTEMIARWLSFHSPPQHLAFSAPRSLRRSRQRRPSSVAGGAEAARFGREQFWEGQLEILEGSFFIEVGIKGCEAGDEGWKSVYRASPIPDHGNAKGCGEISLTRKIASAF